MKRRKSVAFGFLGVKLDAPTGADRWSRFRPTISLCTNETLRVDRLELFHPGDGRAQTTFDRIAADLRDRAPHVELLPRAVPELDPWDFEAVFAHLHDFARTYPFDLEKEEYLVHLTTGTHVAQICLFLLTETRHFPARLVQTAPAKGEDGAPRGGLSIIDLDLARYDRLAERFTAERRRAAEVLKSGIATRNAAFNRLVARVEQVALASTAPMLLLGPTGAGKSQLAKRIYELKRERHVVQGAFVELNCATLRGDAAMSALFGHRKGAYTGATADRPGLLRAADKGLLFLDEIGELGLDEQAMLLRALEERRFLPLGGDVEAESDFQLVAGSNRDLGAAVAAGRFREDLMARIDLWTFRLPGLRDRTEDIEPNVDHEIERFAARTGRRVRFAKEARTAYLAFATSPAAAWNANFRDLNASVTRLATLAESGRITLDLVAEERARLESSWNRPAAGGAASLGSGSAAFPFGLASSAVGAAPTTIGLAPTVPGAPPTAASAGPTAAGLERVLKPAALAELDLFDRVQLAAVVDVCRRSRTLSEAGRTLFNASREKKSSANDADRLRKYLARFDLAFADLG